MRFTLVVRAACGARRLLPYRELYRQEDGIFGVELRQFVERDKEKIEEGVPPGKDPTV